MQDRREVEQVRIGEGERRGEIGRGDRVVRDLAGPHRAGGDVAGEDGIRGDVPGDDRRIEDLRTRDTAIGQIIGHKRTEGW